MPDPTPQPLPDPKPVKKPVNKAVIAVLITVLVLALLLGTYVAVGHLAPELLDNILYTPEELEILNYKNE